MKLRYEQLFGIDARPEYYTDDQAHDDLLIKPTGACQKQMDRFRILHRKTFSGIVLLYECDPTKTDSSAFKPIVNEEKFTFTIRTNNADFWFYADVQGWKSESVFLIRNPKYNVTGDIAVLSGPLTGSILFRPMLFKYDVPLENVSGLLEVRNANGNIIRTIVVRAKTSAQPPGAKESYLVDLTGYAEGQYSFRHITSGGNVDEQAYCSADYSPDVLAIIEITYKGGAGYTGIAPFQRYLFNVASRKADWFYDVHLRERNVPIALASQLSIAPAGIFSRVSFNDAQRFVQFKSSAPLGYSQSPLRLRLMKTASTAPLMDPLPLPSSLDVQKDSLDNLFSKVIVNV
jgi:hypothetical protein